VLNAAVPATLVDLIAELAPVAAATVAGTAAAAAPEASDDANRDSANRDKRLSVLNVVMSSLEVLTLTIPLTKLATRTFSAFPLNMPYATTSFVTSLLAGSAHDGSAQGGPAQGGPEDDGNVLIVVNYLSALLDVGACVDDLIELNLGAALKSAIVRYSDRNRCRDHRREIGALILLNCLLLCEQMCHFEAHGTFLRQFYQSGERTHANDRNRDHCESALKLLFGVARAAQIKSIEQAAISYVLASTSLSPAVRLVVESSGSMRSALESQCAADTTALIDYWKGCLHGMSDDADHGQHDNDGNGNRLKPHHVQKRQQRQQRPKSANYAYSKHNRNQLLTSVYADRTTIANASAKTAKATNTMTGTTGKTAATAMTVMNANDKCVGFLDDRRVAKPWTGLTPKKRPKSANVVKSKAALNDGTSDRTNRYNAVVEEDRGMKKETNVPRIANDVINNVLIRDLFTPKSSNVPENARDSDEENEKSKRNNNDFIVKNNRPAAVLKQFIHPAKLLNILRERGDADEITTAVKHGNDDINGAPGAGDNVSFAEKLRIARSVVESEIDEERKIVQNESGNVEEEVNEEEVKVKEEKKGEDDDLGIVDDDDDDGACEEKEEDDDEEEEENDAWGGGTTMRDNDTEQQNDAKREDTGFGKQDSDDVVTEIKQRPKSASVKKTENKRKSFMKRPKSATMIPRRATSLGTPTKTTTAAAASTTATRRTSSPIVARPRSISQANQIRGLAKAFGFKTPEKVKKVITHVEDDNNAGDGNVNVTFSNPIQSNATPHMPTTPAHRTSLITNKLTPEQKQTLRWRKEFKQGHGERVLKDIFMRNSYVPEIPDEVEEKVVSGNHIIRRATAGATAVGGRERSFSSVVRDRKASDVFEAKREFKAAAYVPPKPFIARPRATSSVNHNTGMPQRRKTVRKHVFIPSPNIDHATVNFDLSNPLSSVIANADMINTFTSGLAERLSKAKELSKKYNVVEEKAFPYADDIDFVERKDDNATSASASASGPSPFIKDVTTDTQITQASADAIQDLINSVGIKGDGIEARLNGAEEEEKPKQLFILKKKKRRKSSRVVEGVKDGAKDDEKKVDDDIKEDNVSSAVVDDEDRVINKVDSFFAKAIQPRERAASFTKSIVKFATG
jgi:hypothetical protein